MTDGTDTRAPRGGRILVDADACPVKEEVFRVAKRYGLHVTLVSGQWLRLPVETWNFAATAALILL